MRNFVAVILILSLGLNAYFLFKINTNETALQSALPSKSKNLNEPNVTNLESSDTDKKITQERLDERVKKAEDAALQEQVRNAVIAPQAMSVNELFALLQTLQSRQKYVDLKLPLREYLKLYPNDYKAWLIEADFILHTEPLSSAIVFYYDLLEKMLPEVEENKVTRIIQLNTSKAIQQLSRDTAWDLLATFIEPLLQIDPLNRGYIMALAKAYGKQGQATLMEDALAALPYDDPRAQQLRNSIYSPTAADIADEVQNEVTETASLSKRKVPVLGNGNQFFVRTKIDSYSQLLLVDTGASTTAISNRVFIKLPESDKEFVGRFTVQTAGGNIEAPLFKLTAITLGDITINNVSVIILPDESFSGTFQGLLGMNVLKNFDFRFDPEKQQMTLFER
jgi:clan AA aspartic protease (TIGR02281 family)